MKYGNINNVNNDKRNEEIYIEWVWENEGFNYYYFISSSNSLKSI